MTAKLIDGKQIAARNSIQEVKAAVSARQEQGLPVPGLATVLVGDDPASKFTFAISRKRVRGRLALSAITFRLKLPSRKLKTWLASSMPIQQLTASSCSSFARHLNDEAVLSAI